ncbi:MAG: hypothetical protein IBX55_19975 [Methyloprofundus sp.]|nr:hypothetical protein [Methyloprofundus sp.]
MEKIIAIIAVIANVVSRLLRKKEQEEYQHESDAITSRPGAWFDDHFNGRVHEHTDLPTDANDTRQADAAKLRDK